MFALVSPPGPLAHSPAWAISTSVLDMLASQELSAGHWLRIFHFLRCAQVVRGRKSGLKQVGKYGKTRQRFIFDFNKTHAFVLPYFPRFELGASELQYYYSLNILPGAWDCFPLLRIPFWAVFGFDMFWYPSHTHSLAHPISTLPPNLHYLWKPALFSVPVACENSSPLTGHLCVAEPEFVRCAVGRCVMLGEELEIDVVREGRGMLRICRGQTLQTIVFGYQGPHL